MKKIMNRREAIAVSMVGAIGATVFPGMIFAAESDSIETRALDSDALKIQVRRAVEKACRFLRDRQSENGAFGEMAPVGVTSLVVSGLLAVGVNPDDPMVSTGLNYITSKVQSDGGIYSDQRAFISYETSLAVTTLARADAKMHAKYTKLIEAASECLRREQWGADESIDVSDPAYGGSGYGTKQRPDLSNTQFFMEALHAAGAGSDDPAMQKALAFVSRCQNLESEHNTSLHATKVNDGGFYYTVVAGGESPAGIEPDGGFRSYGSMTYAGLKSMIYAGVTADDVRVKAAVDWLRKYYTMDENPGMGDSGLYYYYHTAAKSLGMLGGMDSDGKFTDSMGVAHDWRSELAAELIRRQQSDGSWANKNPRWMENDPLIATGYVLMTLGYVMENEHHAE